MVLLTNILKARYLAHSGRRARAPARDLRTSWANGGLTLATPSKAPFSPRTESLAVQPPASDRVTPGVLADAREISHDLGRTLGANDRHAVAAVCKDPQSDGDCRRSKTAGAGSIWGDKDRGGRGQSSQSRARLCTSSDTDVRHARGRRQADGGRDHRGGSARRAAAKFPTGNRRRLAGSRQSETGAVTSARNLPGWEDTFELASVLSETLGTRVVVGNDVQVATDAEFKLGAGKPYQSLLGVFWGTGVGGGLILSGKPWVGRGGAGEIGHVVVEIDGARCGCGRRGCMEAYAGRGAMEARARRRVEKGNKSDLFTLMKEHGRTRLTSSIWFHALERKDKVATKIIDEAVVALGAGIGSSVNLLDVEAVIIGGGLGVRFGEPFANRIAAAMQPHLFNDRNPPDVRVAELGDLGGALGAALLARQTRRARRKP